MTESKFLRHVECEKCGSSNGNSLFDDVVKLFEYRDGSLYWKEKTSKASHVAIGDKAGGESSYGYIRIRCRGKKYFEHRLIFLMFNGYLPKCLDHINGNRKDNRIENLREATHSQNSSNKKINSNSSSGIKGVTMSSRGNYVVRVMVKGKRIFNRTFKDIELAELVAQEARDLHHKEFARNG